MGEAAEVAEVVSQGACATVQVDAPRGFIPLPFFIRPTLALFQEPLDLDGTTRFRVPAYYRVLVDAADAFNIAMETLPEEMRGDNLSRIAAGGSPMCSEWEARARQSALTAVVNAVHDANGIRLA